MSVLEEHKTELAASCHRHEEECRLADFLTAALSPEVDRPTGRTEGVTSLITGKPLRYFIPDPLPDLLARCDVPCRPTRGTYEPYVSLMFVRAASRRGLGGEVDTNQALRYCEVISGRKTYQTSTQLMELGRQISPGNKGLRQEIIFSGASVASEATHIFSPYPILPQLMDSLVEVLSEGRSETDASVLSAIVGFYCVHMHPFLDGNGRWSRLIAASATASAGNAVPAMIGAVLQNTCKAELADQVWPSVRSNGARDYLNCALRFEDELTDILLEHGLFETVGALNAELKKASRNSRDFQSIVAAAYGRGSLSVGWMRATLGMSSRAFTGLVEKLLLIGNGAIELSREFLNIEPLLARVDAAITMARKSIIHTGGEK